MFQPEDNSKNGRLHGVPSYLPTEKSNHIRIESTEIELEEPDPEQEIAMGTSKPYSIRLKIRKWKANED